MEQTVNKIEELLEKLCYVIDFLPEQVNQVQEDNFLMLNVIYSIVINIFVKDKFVNIIIKLMCYYHVSI